MDLAECWHDEDFFPTLKRLHRKQKENMVYFYGHICLLLHRAATVLDKNKSEVEDNKTKFSTNRGPMWIFFMNIVYILYCFQMKSRSLLKQQGNNNEINVR